ncbi:MAG: bifunctional phosphopantothenoylcysteine decarboxylase/phosphopantothenate synthase [Candidatus Sumerlaeaceae bacterium]|nr:bifunctional phosphopantothenoylcysteine decarboxylase/phosphopantothenate synthase [Candidatus Sumerlaeaceae bacterium]
MLTGKKVILGVSGSISAFRAADICSQLRKAGAEVRVAMTASATKFISPLTFEALTQHPVYSAIFDEPSSHEMEHIAWGKWGDLLLIAPTSANLMARMAAGMADDAVSSLYLCFRGAVAVAPAMNTAMWEHPATRQNLSTLAERGATIIEPDSGVLACGDVGMGKLPPSERIVAVAEQLLSGKVVVQATVESSPVTITAASPAQESDNTLAGRNIIVTSGPTHEYLDPVRFLTNPSTGKMGAAIAREAARRGAAVTLVTGPVSPANLPALKNITIRKVVTAQQMLEAVQALTPAADVFVFAAAVSDFRFANPVGQKIKRSGNSVMLPMIENPDIAQLIGRQKKHNQISVGFAAETHDLETNAISKLEKKNLDAIVANDVANPRIGFERDDNEVTIYLRNGGKVSISQRPKEAVAQALFETLLPLINSSAASAVAK